MEEWTQFNLIDHVWIPVRERSKGQRMASIADCFLYCTEILDFAVRPHERVALLRFLLAILHAALKGPKDYNDRCQCASHIPDVPLRYLDTWHDKFDLFHPSSPFLQIAGLKSGGKDEADLTSFAKLDFAQASGNNATLFDHGRSSKPSPAKLALNLLTYQMFSPGGLISKVSWQGKVTTGNSSDAPCVVGSMLHTFLRGRNLQETMLLNLCPRDIVGMRYGKMDEDWWGKPVWEHFPASPDDQDAIRNATRTYVGRMVPLSRAIWIRSDGLVHGDGLPYPNFLKKENPFVQEPSGTKIIVKKDKKEEEKLLSYKKGRAVWRDLASITMHAGKGQNSATPLALITLPKNTVCDLIVMALPRNQMSVLDSVESIYALNPKLMDEEGVKLYENGVNDAEKTAKCLGRAISVFRQTIDGWWGGRLKTAGKDKGKLIADLQYKALLQYWTSVEEYLPLLFQTLDALDEEPIKKWKKTLIEHAHTAYESVCAEMSAKHVQAYVRGASCLPSLSFSPKKPKTGKEVA